MNNSPGPDADADLEERGEEVKLEGTEQLYGPNPLREKLEVEKGTEMEIQTKGGGEISGQSQPSERSEEEHSRGYPTPTVESGGDMQVDVPIGETPMQHENVNAAIEQQRLKVCDVSLLLFLKNIPCSLQKINFIGLRSFVFFM